MNKKNNKLAILFVPFFFLIFANFLSAQNFPVSVKDGTNHLVNLQKKPEKIISLGAASTEILFEIAAENQIAAVSDVSNYPPKAKNLPSAGGFSSDSISFEKILSFQPDFVILYSGMHDSFIPNLEKYRISYYVSDVKTVADVIEEIKNIAVLTGHKARGDELAEKYTGILNGLQKKTLAQSPEVYWEVWYEPFMSAGKQSFINDVITLAGGINIFGEINQSYPIVSEETIIASNPDFILVPNDTGISVENVKNRGGWNQIEAVKNNKIFVFDADVYTRSGPRIFDAIQELNGIFYGKSE